MRSLSSVRKRSELKSAHLCVQVGRDASRSAAKSPIWTRNFGDLDARDIVPTSYESRVSKMCSAYFAEAEARAARSASHQSAIFTGNIEAYRTSRGGASAGVGCGFDAASFDAP